MRLGKLPEAWIATHEVRELRELVRFRARLVMLRTGLKAQLNAVLAKHGLLMSQRRRSWHVSKVSERRLLKVADSLPDHRRQQGGGGGRNPFAGADRRQIVPKAGTRAERPRAVLRRYRLRRERATASTGRL
jgi:hypothetical protein